MKVEGGGGEGSGRDNVILLSGGKRLGLDHGCLWRGRGLKSQKNGYVIC